MKKQKLLNINAKITTSTNSKKLTKRDSLISKTSKVKQFKTTELKEQIALIQRCEIHPILSKYLIAIPNGGSRHILEAVNLKKSGVKKGVSDLFLAYPSKKFHGCWIELKVPKAQKSKVSKEQENWLELMSNVSYAAYVCYGCEEAYEMLLNYLNY